MYNFELFNELKRGKLAQKTCKESAEKYAEKNTTLKPDGGIMNTPRIVKQSMKDYNLEEVLFLGFDPPLDSEWPGRGRERVPASCRISTAHRRWM